MAEPGPARQPTPQDEIPRHWGLVSLAALLAIIIVPPWLCIVAGGAEEFIALGALVWGASVVAKGPIARGVNRLARSWSHEKITGLQGFVSAAVELGAAAAFLAAWSPASLADVVGFGVGAGSGEAAYALGRGVLGKKPDADQLAAWARGAKVSLCVRYMVPIERFFALVGHVGARGLVFVGLAAALLPGILCVMAALALFSAIDGIAVYGHLRGWQWVSPHVCRRAHLFFASVGAAEAALFLVGFRLLI